MISPVLFQSRSLGTSLKRKREFPTKLETELRRFSFSFCANSRLSKTKRPTGAVDKRYSVIGRLTCYADVLQANSKSSTALHNYYRNTNICITQPCSRPLNPGPPVSLLVSFLVVYTVVVNHNNYIVTEKYALEVAINVYMRTCMYCLLFVYAGVSTHKLCVEFIKRRLIQFS